MPYVQMQDVRLGMDRKRALRVASELGSAWTIVNGHLTRGGDVERRRKFVRQPTPFPSTTAGLYAIDEALFTVGTDSSEAANVPVGVTHVLTEHPLSPTPIDRVRDAEAFDGLLYSIIEFTDGNLYHYYNDERVTDWDILATEIGSNDAVASALSIAIDNSTAVDATVFDNTVTITSSVAGTPFTIEQQTINNGSNPDQTITLVESQENISGVDMAASGADITITGGTPNAGTNNMTSITVDGIDILGGPPEVLATASLDVSSITSGGVSSITIDGVEVLLGGGITGGSATALAERINSSVSSPNYTATASGDILTISGAVGSGSLPNGFTVVLTPTITPIIQTNMLGGAFAGVPWSTSNSQTAADIAAQINTNTSTPNYTATTDGPVLTINAPVAEGSSLNGLTVATTQSGDLTSSGDTVTSGGVDPVTAVPQVWTATIGGTFETADQFVIIINGTENYLVSGAASGTGTSVLTYRQKLYSTASSNLYFSALNAPTQWIAGLDSGFINMSSQTAGEETLTVAQEYQGLVAVFSENNIRIWSISEDSDFNVFIQTMQNTGTIAPESVVPYGNNDVFYLDTSGIRSIRARDSSNAAFVSDVGTPIDTHIREYLDTLTEEEIASAVGIVEPIDGRFWLGIKNRIYVLSFFPSARISAWSFYEVDFEIKNIARAGDRVFVRGTEDGVDYLYLYGGANNDEFPDADEDIFTIELPYFGANNPAAFKDLIGFDIIGINTWKVDVLLDPADETVIKSQGFAVGTTYGKQRFGATGVTPLFAVNLTCSDAGPATLSALAMHYNGTFEDG